MRVGAMYFDPFRNRWAALALAGLILLAAAALVGSEDGGGLLDRMADRQRAEAPPQPAELREDLPSPELAPPERAFSEPVDRGSFTPEAELIDDAQGFDTTPPIVHEGLDDGLILEAGEEAPMLPSDVEGPGS